MTTRLDIITNLETILDDMKGQTVLDLNEYAWEHSIYSIESAIEILKENER